jgi:hypothetical protein
MRTYARIVNSQGTSRWIVVQTDAAGYDDYVYANTLIQTLKLSINESPFYANYGIPAQRAVIQQVFPDYYVFQTQAQFAQHFASLIISKLDNTEPTYQVNITTNQGVKLQTSVLDGQRYNQFAITDTGVVGVDDSGNAIIVG